MTVCDDCGSECSAICDECGGDFCDTCLTECKCHGYHCCDCKNKHYVPVEEDGKRFYDLCPSLKQEELPL